LLSVVATRNIRLPHKLPIVPNVLDRNFTVEKPNRAWTGDVTYIATEEGWLYLAVVIDLFSRRIVGWSKIPFFFQSCVVVYSNSVNIAAAP
jgi:transposase InsO family protein